MKVNLDYLKSPIVPMYGVADIKLRTKRESAIKILGEPLRVIHKSDSREFLEYTGVTVVLEYNIVEHIVAELGYEGVTPNGLKVGSRWKEVLNLYPRTTFHEDEGLWYAPGINGMSFDIVRPPKPDETPADGSNWVDEMYDILDPENAFVISISVHDIRYGDI